MAYGSSNLRPAPRMQTNAAWTSPAITFYTGTPRAAVDMGGWNVHGVAIGARGARIALNTDNSKLVFDNATAMRVVLSVDDMARLGAGPVEIEIIRSEPDPVRPLIRLRGECFEGLA